MASTTLINPTTTGQSSFRKKYSVTLADIKKNVAALGSTTTCDIALETLPAGAIVTGVRVKHNTALASGVGSSTFNCRPFYPAGGTGMCAAVHTLMTTGTTVAVGTAEGTGLRSDNGAVAALAAYAPTNTVDTPTAIVLTVAITAGSAVLADITAFGVDVWLDYIVLS